MPAPLVAFRTAAMSAPESPPPIAWPFSGLVAVRVKSAAAAFVKPSEGKVAEAYEEFKKK